MLRRDYDRYNKSENTLELKLLQRNSDQHWIKTIKNQIGQYSSWQYPGIELNPVDGTLTRSMLSVILICPTVVLLLIKIRLKITLMTSLQKKDCFFIVISTSCLKTNLVLQ